MVVNNPETFISTCKRKFCLSYNKRTDDKITSNDVIVGWFGYVNGNMRCALASRIVDDDCYGEYTFNREKSELVENFYVMESKKTFK